MVGMREIRGNAIQLQIPVTKTNKDKDRENHDKSDLFGNTEAQENDEYVNLQRSQEERLEFEKQQQHAYILAHGGGLIPPANLNENPFSQYMKSINTTVGQIENFEIKTIQSEQTSRNQKRKVAQSLQPINKNTIQLKDKLESTSLKRPKPLLDILTSNLGQNEMQALRVANPLHHAFNNHLSKVISSVQHRKQRGDFQQDSEAQMLAITEGNLQEMSLMRSETDTFQKPNRLNVDESQSLKGHSISFVMNTPQRVRAEAQKELALLADVKSSRERQLAKPYSMFKQQVQDSYIPQQRSIDQITTLVNRLQKNKDQIFIPLEPQHDNVISGVYFKDAKNLEEVHAGQVVFTKNSLITISQNNQMTQVVSKEKYIQENVQQMILNQVPFFRKFLPLKTFKLWKQRMQQNVYNRTREKLAQNFIFSKPIFAQSYNTLITNANQIRYHNMVDSKPNMLYGQNKQSMFDFHCSTLCQQSQDKIVESLQQIQQTLEVLRDEIKKDDTEFIDYCRDIEEIRIINEKSNKQELVLMSKTRAAKDAENKQKQLMVLRQNQYNNLVQMLSRIMFQNFSELLIENKKKFTQLFCANKATTQFQINLSIDSQGKLTTTPNSLEHKEMFNKVFTKMEETIFKNYFVGNYFQDLVSLLFWEDKKTNPPGAPLMRRQLKEIEIYVKKHPIYINFQKQINQQVESDLIKLQQHLGQYSEVEDVYDFTHDWNEKRRLISQGEYPKSLNLSNGVSAEIEFYKITWVKLEQLSSIIEKIPVSYAKVGTIILETASLKKFLSDMPRQIIELIRTNVTQTIESETKALKEELTITSNTLSQQPITLNMYVDQINTLKYLKEKENDFKNKFQTIVTLQKQCKMDNIKITPKLTSNIEEVSQLYDNQPNIIKKAQEGLRSNKNQIEQQMIKSSDALSLKIKAFEKKYVETYLQDKQRLERCKETLDEILRRSQAIIEIKSKVVLYKEFLKILYEDDPDAEEKISKKKLSCATDCDAMEEIHKNTIKMWKIFIYWTKKRQQCFTTPFLDFDLKIILKAINKITKFLSDQPKQSEFVAYKAQPITRSVNAQVKDTQIIVEFVKEMNRDTLKTRHWYQIFTILKASHLKNSTTFTIIDLRESNIQNSAADIKIITEHANTEAKYETVFKSIKQEWEDSNLKVMPFQDQKHDYILVNSDLMSDAIEDNLSTLDTIARSKYAAHVTEEIQELIEQLKTMLQHIILWSQAQKYWMTLDPIYNCGLLSDFFKENTGDFLETRSAFRRIMWSSYRRPKTTYCLMITERLIIFQKLIDFYALIQQQVNNFLEKKRLEFARFYFLTDSQFLDMMMLVNSNKDFNVYVNFLFQGAQKLYITDLLQDQDLLERHTIEDVQETDLANQLEQIIWNCKNKNNVFEEEKSEINFNFSNFDIVLAKPAVNIKIDSYEPSNRVQEEVSYKSEESEHEQNLQTYNEIIQDQFNEPVLTTQDSKHQKLVKKKVDSVPTEQIVLGFISQNKELLLFENHVSISKPIESWLNEVEIAMQDSLKKQMMDSIQNFISEPMEQWILDYPQQITISTLHLILSQEITDVLANNDKKPVDPDGQPQTFERYKELALQIGVVKPKNDDEKNQNKPHQQNYQKAAIYIRKRQSFEPEYEISEQQIQFLDDCFGEQSKIEEPLDKAVQTIKRDESESTFVQKKNMQQIRKTGYKEQVLQVLQYKSLDSVNVRLQFWINKIHKLLYQRDQKVTLLPGVQKCRIKSIILFLKHQQEQVEALIKLQVSNVNDFEWQSKVRLTWNSENETQVMCGGWTHSLKYEYLGTTQRLIITPLTTRYFVFMASALREKQSALLRCSISESTGAEIVQEFASLCQQPFRSHKCTISNSLSSLTQLLNGGAMANIWVFFEHLDNLPIAKLQIIVKEIQILHQQFIVSGFQRNLLKERIAKQQGIQVQDLELNSRNEVQTLGIFSSTSIKIKQSANHFLDQVKASFRIVSLAKPNLEKYIQNLLFTENYTEYRSQSSLFTQFIYTFLKNKSEKLMEPITTEVEIGIIKQSVRLASILSNQEFNAYSLQQLEIKRIDEAKKAGQDSREIYVAKNVERGCWEIRKKLRDQYIAERNQLSYSQSVIQNEKFKIELDCLKDSVRQVFLKHYLNDFAVTEKQQSNLKGVEEQLQELILKSYNEVIKITQDTENRQNAMQNKVKMSLLKQLVTGLENEQPKSGVPQLPAAEKLALQRTNKNSKKQKQDSLIEYKPKFDSQKDGSVRQQVDLFYSKERNLEEDKFQSIFIKNLKKVAKDLHFELTQDQIYNCVALVESMKRSKGVAIVGPICSGKTQLVKLVTLALKKACNTVLRTSYISPDTFSFDDLYGATLAFDQNSAETLQTESIFQVILNIYQREKQLLDTQQKDSLIQALYIDQTILSQELSDSFNSFMQMSNLREREYLFEKEFNLDFLAKIKQTQKVENIPVRFQNGNVIKFPSDLFIFFECHSLKYVSPTFLQQISVVSTQANDVRYTHILSNTLKSIKQKHYNQFKTLKLDFEFVEECVQEFLLPFIKQIDKNIVDWPLWDLNSLTLQFSKLLDASLYKILELTQYFIQIEDDSYPIQEMQRDAFWNIVLSTAIWSYGAVLNKEQRTIFDDQFSIYKQKFNMAINSKQKLKLFDIFFDIPKLIFVAFTDKLEYKLKSYFEPALQALLLPTVDISQAFYLLDQQVYYMTKDKELNKSFRLFGPSSSSKTVILNTFASRLQQSTHTISVPMTAYLTLELFKTRVEESYRKKRESSLVPKDSSKQILLVIDDVHMQGNLKVEILEFIRCWCFNRGYFSVQKNHFKKIADFGCIIAQNSSFKSTSPKQDRFLYYTTTVYCNEIEMSSYKMFIQSWLTSNAWSVSQLISKYYLLISNALMQLLEKMKVQENVINNYSYSSLVSFHFVARFCANLVNNCSFTDNKVDVYGAGFESKERKEQEAVADLFCYEIMRTFGDRLMRPSSKIFFMEKLVQIVQKEFLCKEYYNTAYLEQLIMGNYHCKEEGAYMKQTSIMNQSMRDEACSMIRAKTKKLSGNSFLAQLLDSPQGLADCFRLSRILFKPQQNLILMGQSGVSKLEMLQLAAITNNVTLLEIDASTFGEPLKFAYNLRQILLLVSKMNRSSYILINDQVIRDPIYFDYIFNFMQQLSRHESFVMFDDQFFIDLAAIEANHLKKVLKVAVPDEYILFKQAIRKLQKNCHFVFVMSDLMTYKEIVQMYPQLEYMCEVLYMEDLTQKDYLEMTNNFLIRSNVQPELLGDDYQFSHSLIEVRNRVKQLMLKSFYSPSMLKFTLREEYFVHGASEYILNDSNLINMNIFTDSKGYQVVDEDLSQVLLNMPIDVLVSNKHRFGVFIEVCKFIFDLLSMHLTARKSYYETFLAKGKQFQKYFSSIKESKKGLHEDQNSHSFRVAMTMDKIKEIKNQLIDKQSSIKMKTAEVRELQEELYLSEEEVGNVIDEKNQKLDQTIEEMKKIKQSTFTDVISSQFQEFELQLLKLINIIVMQEDEIKFSRQESLHIFTDKDELINVLDSRRNQKFNRTIFERLHEFVSNRIGAEFSDVPLMFLLYSFVVELYRKLNIKNTMASTFTRIKEIKQHIDANTFSINYCQQSIESKNEELRIQSQKLHDLETAGSKLSRKIEEAELSYMRTDQIFNNVEEYSKRMEQKLQSITSRSQTLLGDSILLASSVVYLGVFSPEERENFRMQLITYLSKVRNIQFNKIWTETSNSQTANPNKSMFIKVLKDLGLREILVKHNLPAVLSSHQFGEALFSMFFAPSCPVICDPTGVVEEFVKEKLFANMDPQIISGSDINANEKLNQSLASNKPSIVLDVNCLTSSKFGLTNHHNILRTLSNTLYNGVDFESKRLGQAKKVGAIGCYITHSTGLNKRIPVISAQLEHISIYQAQIFQPGFDFQLTQDYLQNATFICAAPSLILETRNKLEENGAIILLKELIIEKLLPSSFEFKETKEAIANLNKKILQLERNYENAFLIASGETIRKLGEYSVLRQAVEDIIEAREQKESNLIKYRANLKKIRLVTEASDVIFQMYLVLKLVGKQSNTITYSWPRFLKVVDLVLQKLIQNIKQETIKARAFSDAQNGTLDDVEIEIDNSFFKQRFVPLVHQTIVSSINSQFVPLFNFFLSLRLAHTYKAISSLEHAFILKQLVDLKGYKKWRNPDHQFILLNEVVDKIRHQNLKRELLRLYPDVARQVFDQIDKILGSSFQYIDASIFIQKELKERYKLTQVQQLTFGFLCPDTEFKSKLTLFMYTQNMATFDFTEEVIPFGEFLTQADYQSPICLKSQPQLNTVNLITTLAHSQGRSLIVLRTDPTYQAIKQNSQVFNMKLTERINSQLLDYATVRYSALSVINDQVVKESAFVSQNEVIPKQLWLALKQREVNLDEGKVFFSENENTVSLQSANPHIQTIVEAAHLGQWVLICPVQFPHYFNKLFEKLDHMKNQDQISPNFRLMIDLQYYNQNEIPDSFIFSDSYSFNLSESNLDSFTTLNDIWSKILNPVMLERLTDPESGNIDLKKIEFQPESNFMDKPVQFMQVFSKESKDQHALNLFNKFIQKSTIDFSNKLKLQRVKNLEKLKFENENIQGRSDSPVARSLSSSHTLNDQEVNQEVAAIHLAELVAAVTENEGPRLDYDHQINEENE